MLGGVVGETKIRVKLKGALIRPSGTFSRGRGKVWLRGGFGFARGLGGLGWVGRGLGEELGEEWGQGLGAGGVEGVGADAVEAGGEVAFVFAVAAEVEEAVFVDEGGVGGGFGGGGVGVGDPAGGFRSEEHTSELQSLMRISYAVFCLTQKTKMQH